MTHSPPRLAVFGDPVDHSLSPQLHRLFARQTGIELTYDKLRVPAGALAAVLPGFELNQGIGANVTLPLKEEAYQLATERTARAELAGSVNTLHRIGADLWFGDNTDGAGFLQDLRQRIGFEPEGRRILVIGAGGAGRGVLAALCGAPPKRLALVNRSPERAASVADDLNRSQSEPAIEFGTLDDAAALGPFDLVVNATSAGLSGHHPDLPGEVFAPDCIAYDLVYGDAARPFLGACRGWGCSRTHDGFGMFVEQGALSFERWFGVHPKTDGITLERLRRGEIPGSPLSAR